MYIIKTKILLRTTSYYLPGGDYLGRSYGIEFTLEGPPDTCLEIAERAVREFGWVDVKVTFGHLECYDHGTELLVPFPVRIDVDVESLDRGRTRVLLVGTVLIGWGRTTKLYVDDKLDKLMYCMEVSLLRKGDGRQRRGRPERLASLFTNEGMSKKAVPIEM